LCIFLDTFKRFYYIGYMGNKSTFNKGGNVIEGLEDLGVVIGRSFTFYKDGRTYNIRRIRKGKVIAISGDENGKHIKMGVIPKKLKSWIHQRKAVLI